MKLSSRSLAIGVLVSLLLLLVACGGGKPAVTTPAQEPPGDTDTGAVPATPSDRDTYEREEPDTTVDKDPWQGRGFDNENVDSQDMMGSRDADYYMQQRVLKNIYFALDKHDLTEEARSTLKNNSTWLKAHDEFGIVVEGHCDERGSIEYNLALGERRANAVREYLTDLGIDHSRMRLVSYGEERPVADGSSESAWSQNRRAAFIIEER